MALDKTDSDLALDLEVREPKLYEVHMLNDDYTTQEFVVEILVEVFRKTRAQANEMMLRIHKDGRTVVGIYPYDLAVSKVRKTTNLARKAEFPLRCLIEEI